MVDDPKNPNNTSPDPSELQDSFEDSCTYPDHYNPSEAGSSADDVTDTEGDTVDRTAPESDDEVTSEEDTQTEETAASSEESPPKEPESADEASDSAAESDKPSVKKEETSLESEWDVKEKELGGRMTFLEHLDELRKRISYSLISIVIAFGGAWGFRESVYDFISKPIADILEELIVIKPTDPFTIYLKVSFVVAVFVASPIILFQVWLFIAPGLYRKEKGYVLPFLLCSTVLFLLGGAFAYWVVLPPALNFLLVEFGRRFQPMISAVEYFDFALLIIIGMGVVFQLPVLVAFLSIFGLVTPRFLWKNFRYAFLIITIIAAVVSPTTDPFNLFLWSGPMVILYTVSIAVSWIFQRRRKRKQEAA